MAIDNEEPSADPSAMMRLVAAEWRSLGMRADLASHLTA